MILTRIGYASKTDESLDALDSKLESVLIGDPILNLEAPLKPDQKWERLFARFPNCTAQLHQNPESALAWLDAGARQIAMPHRFWGRLIAEGIPGDRLVPVFESEEEADLHAFLKIESAPWPSSVIVKSRSLAISLVDNARQRETTVALFVESSSIEPAAFGDLHRRGIDVIVDGDDSNDSQHVSLVTDCLGQIVKSDRSDGLIPTVIVDRSGIALGLVYSNMDSIRESIATRRGVYWSRSRQQLWRKGESSGASQVLHRIDLDCDGDALRYTVTQRAPGFCHLNRRTCFGLEGTDLNRVFRRIQQRVEDPVPESYTDRLVKSPDLLAAKLIEEAHELVAADSQDDTVWEAADLIYFCMVRVARDNVAWRDVVTELIRRTAKISRRPGNAKKNFQSQLDPSSSIHE